MTKDMLYYIKHVGNITKDVLSCAFINKTGYIYRYVYKHNKGYMYAHL